ncbi:MAG: CsbD family protein [Polyangiaceae bacterium]
MNWDRIEGKWDEFKGQVRSKWAKLTDDDFAMLRGKREQLSGAIQSRYGMMKDDAERQIDDWLTTLDSSKKRHSSDFRDSRP